MPEFKLVADFQPQGDQPKAISGLAQGIKKGYPYQTLLGVTGSGKTFTMAGVVEQVQWPTLVIAHNKTLAAQLCSEFREFFPHNAVEYFVSYYDYYQPEAYVPQTDTYIEKDSSINEDIDRLRLSATSSLFERPDVIIVASVSCIYGLGSPADYLELTCALKRGMLKDRDEILRELVNIQYHRNDIALERGSFRVRGDTVEIYPAYQDRVIRVGLFGDEIESLYRVNPLTGEILSSVEDITIYPASHFVTPEEKIQQALISIEEELQERLQQLRENDRLLEAQRLEQRTRYDIEMLAQVGFCSGIENYSRHLDGRPSGSRPHTLLDYFPPNFLVFIDESHMTIPQIGGMYAGDRSRKEKLVEYGFRLPSALDNRPLNFQEFEALVSRAIYISATPKEYELHRSSQVMEQIVRPTGLVDPQVQVKPTRNQVDDLMEELDRVIKKGSRALVTTLTKKMAEDLTLYLAEAGIKVRYLHSDIDTLERLEIIRDLRLGIFHVLVGINLLREGLDLPEVSLVAILDADKEGFLRSDTALIQTIGRAARHVEGRVLMYGDTITSSMDRALKETERRREKQIQFNRRHGITPIGIKKAVREVLRPVDMVAEEVTDYDETQVLLSSQDRQVMMAQLEKEMFLAAEGLDFEKAAQLRDRLLALKNSGEEER